MILSRAPLRVSFLGGSSDIPKHYLRYSGATLSCAIDKYVYVAVMHTPKKHIKVSYTIQEEVEKVDDIKNDIVRNALKHYGITSNIEITVFADIPTVGSGLGGSSAFTCALIVALEKYLNFHSSLIEDKYRIAEIACTIEINYCGWNIGKQDQYASSFGGANYIEYSIDDLVYVSNVDMESLNGSMILIPTYVSRHSNDVLTTVKYRPARKINKSENKTWCQVGADSKSILFNMNRIDPTKPLVITEGEIDSLSVIESGYKNVTSVPFGAGNFQWIEENWDWLEQFEQIICWSDSDEPGIKMRKEVCSRLGNWRCKFVDIPKDMALPDGKIQFCKDANEVLYHFGKNKVLELIGNAQELPTLPVKRFFKISTPTSYLMGSLPFL